MSRIQWVLGLVALLVAGVVVVIVAGILPDDDTVPPLSNAFEGSPSGFTFNYPDGWRSIIPQTGLLILAQPETFAGEPGPAFTAQRSIPLMLEGDLSAALAAYLQRGPLHPDREWEMVTEVTPTRFNGRDALTVDLVGREYPEAPESHIRLVITNAANGIVYVLAISAPLEVWTQYEPTLDAILNSVLILE